jgi:predicted RNase H-like nuclease (RuvC/YqgF family)
MKDDMTKTSLKGVIVLLIIFCIWIIVSNTRKSKELEKLNDDKIEQLTRKVDSLGSEIFILNTNIMRYEIAVEMLEDENPKAASEFYKRLSMTE